MRKGRILGLVLGLVMAVASSSSASIVLDNWSINLTGVDGYGAKIINNVSEITYVGMAHNFDYAVPYGTVDGLLTATGLLSGGSVIPLTSLNDSWGLTFDFSVDNMNYYVDPVTGANSFFHLSPLSPSSGTVDGIPYVGYTPYSDGLLDVWIDNFANNATDPGTGLPVGISDLTTGLGYTNTVTGETAVKVATFRVTAGEGGIFSPATFDGSDDATFELIWALAGVFSAPGLGDLAQFIAGGETVLIAMTDSNLDGDPLNNPNVGFDIGVGTYPDIETTWPFSNAQVGGANGAFFKEDGSVVLGVGVIPEPSTFILLGAGLLGLGIIGRKRMSR